MFTIADKISNGGQQPVSLSSYGRVIRYNKPLVAPTYVLHEGFIGVIARTAYSKANMRQSRGKRRTRKGDGWLARHYRQVLGGDHGPAADDGYNARFSHFTDGQPRFQADYKQDASLSLPANPST